MYGYVYNVGASSNWCGSTIHACCALIVCININLNEILIIYWMENLLNREEGDEVGDEEEAM